MALDTGVSGRQEGKAALRVVHPTYRDAWPGAAAGAAPVKTAMEKAVEIKSGCRPRLGRHRRREGCSLSPGAMFPLFNTH